MRANGRGDQINLTSATMFGRGRICIISVVEQRRVSKAELFESRLRRAVPW